MVARGTKDRFKAVYCRCCEDLAADIGSTDCYVDLDGVLCKACFYELYEGDISLALRDVSRWNRDKIRRIRKR